jgi:rfaE bifunctional protein nucleotidyltransferase chain/domain
MTKWEKLQYKITNAEEAQTVISSWKDNEKMVVFTNGCFDILHRGHVTYLAKAASLGDYLVIGLNSDSSVKAQNKGENRPINDETSRSIVLAALEFVDLIVVFNDTTPLSLIELLEPSILVKGADYDKNETDTQSKRYIVGSKEVLKYGGSVETIVLEEGFSTTSIIEKIKG